MAVIGDDYVLYYSGLSAVFDLYFDSVFFLSCWALCITAR